jgi:uncharacterized protein (TIGR03437 family)
MSGSCQHIVNSWTEASISTGKPLQSSFRVTHGGRKLQKRSRFLIALLFGVPALLFAFSSGPQVRRSGVPSDDNGATCIRCHVGNPLNSPGGRITVEASPYRPGIRQTIRVTVFHPEARRWGFQMTAREVSDENRTAGVFTSNEEVQVVCDDGQPNSTGTPAPCTGGVKEFAEHRQAATRTGENGSKTFLVDWTPPANEVGRIVFYAAGNAANGTGAPDGDRVYTTRIEIPLDPAAACSQTQRPQISRIVDGAAFRTAMAPNGLFTISGSNLTVPGLRRTVGLGDIENSRFPRELGCIAVEVNGQRVPILYAQNDQINAQLPSQAITGPVEVRVIANPGRPNELRSDVGTITLTPNAPQLFTFGTTSVAAVNPDGTYVADPATIPGARPAAPGGVISLYGTGFGTTNPLVEPGEIVAADRLVRLPAGSVQVTIGGTTVPESDILYAGIAPGSISGLYQINVRVPASAANGNLPITIRVNGVESRSDTTLPVRTP